MVSLLTERAAAMRQYEITYSGRCPRTRIAYDYEFCVKEGGESFRVVVGMSHPALYAVSNRAGQTKEELLAQLPQITFKKLRAELLSKGIPAGGDLLMTSHDPEVDNLVRGPKQCQFSNQHGRDYLCMAADVEKDDSEGLTAPYICSNCPVPDSRLVCEHVTGLGTVAPRSMGKDIGDRLVSRVGCALGKQISDVANCVPEGCDSWTYVCCIEEERPFGFGR